jgi:hypothetical protein
LGGHRWGNLRWPSGVIKNKRTQASLHDAVDTELARAKIEANAIADRISINLAAINLHTDKAFLFYDIPSLVLKNADDLTAIVKNRISEHYQAIEAARIEAERQRIAEQERIKAEASARAEERAKAQALAAIAEAQEEPPKQAITPVQPASVATEKAAKTSVRSELNAALDKLNETQLQRILSFVKSRFEKEITSQIEA